MFLQELLLRRRLTAVRQSQKFEKGSVHTGRALLLHGRPIEPQLGAQGRKTPFDQASGSLFGFVQPIRNFRQASFFEQSPIQHISLANRQPCDGCNHFAIPLPAGNNLTDARG